MSIGNASTDYAPQEAWWWRYQVINHKQPERARKKKGGSTLAGLAPFTVLDHAHDLMLGSIETLGDEGLRRNYLNKVALNREIMQAWQTHAVKHKLPHERRFAHLAVESSLREPFERLTEISLRLNALKSIQEIQTFLVEEATELKIGRAHV